MGFRDDKEIVIGNDKNANKSVEPTPDELSDIWQKLLGIHPAAIEANPDIVVIPTSLAEDPWSQLLQAQGARVVDLQHVHLQEIQISLSELELEEALQIMQEQPIQDKNQA
jgi:hypothetical protein